MENYTIITDLDGTLCDVMEANVAAYREAFRLFGYDFDEKKFRKHFGYRFDDMMDAIAPSIGNEHRKKIAEKKTETYQDNLHLLVPNHRLIHYLKEAKKRGSKIGLATTARETNARSVLNRLELQDFFDTYVFGEDVSHGKPHPECYQKAIKLLAANPLKCVVFEDTEIGCEAAQSAGIGFVIKVVV